MSEPEFHSIQEPELSETSDMHLLLSYPTCFRFALLDIPDLYGMALGQWANPKSWRFGWTDFWLMKWIHHEGREVQTYLENLNPMLDHFMILNNTMGGGLSPVWPSFHQKGSPSNSNVSFHKQHRKAATQLFKSSKIRPRNFQIACVPAARIIPSGCHFMQW